MYNYQAQSWGLRLVDVSSITVASLFYFILPNNENLF
jgi:hypothetical protein